MHLECVECGEIMHALFNGKEIKTDYDGVIFMVQKDKTNHFIKLFDEDDRYMGDNFNESKAVRDANDNLWKVDEFSCALCDGEVLLSNL